MQLRLKRIYEKPGRNDGKRILVDRIWPRGVKKEDARVDLWLRDVAPSTGLRKWFGHDPQRWNEFERRYFRELDRKGKSIEQLLEVAEDRRVTLLFGAKDERHNNAVALKNYLEKRSPP